MRAVYTSLLGFSELHILSKKGGLVNVVCYKSDFPSGWYGMDYIKII